MRNKAQTSKLRLNLPDGPVELDLPIPTISRGEQAWQGLLRLSLQNLIIRSGFLLCGSYPGTTAFTPSAAAIQTTPDRFRYTGIGIDIPETVSQHAMGCVNLVIVLSIVYPELFLCNPDVVDASCAPLSEFVTYGRDRLSMLLAYHDSGEPFFGDEPDDGSQDLVAKNRHELDLLIAATNWIPDLAIRKRLIQDFACFQITTPPQNIYPGFSEYDRHLIQLARIIDKAEAIFSCLRHESEGHPGDLKYKSMHYDGITDRDAHFAKICQTTNTADTWAAHYVADHHGYYGFSTTLEILKAAVIHVRGQWYPWWDDLCTEYQLNL